MAVSFFGKVIIPFLAYFLVEVTGEQQYGGLGGEITLTPKVSGQPEDILWKHNGNKVVEFDGSQNVEYGRYKGRTILNWSSGALTIKGLTDADSGPYELEAVVKGKLQYSHHEVDVIDYVAQPSISCVVNNTTPENMDRTLLCSADLQPLTQFIWSSPGGSESPGPELFIPGGENQDSENQDSVYTCVVKNPVSEKTAEFTLKDCHTVAVSKPRLTHTCTDASVTLRCDVGNSVNVTWSRNRNILPEQTDATLTITKATLKPEDSYACTASIKASEEKSDDVYPECTDDDSSAVLLFGMEL